MGALDRLEADHICAVVVGYRDALRAHQDRLNRLNVYPVPDGDTGTNMALTLESVVAEMEGCADVASVCKAVSHGSLMGARGNSGVILSQILRGLADGFAAAPVIDAKVVAGALAAASEAAYGAVMKPVEGTILTVVREAAGAAVAAATEGAALIGVLDAAAEAARLAVERTPDLLPVLAEAGVVDAGGAGFVLLVDSFLNVVDGRPLPEPDLASVADGPLHLAGASVVSGGGAGRGDGAGGDGHGLADLRYEVMFLLDAPDAAVVGLKEAWAALGDSIVVVGGDGLWNCHVHTDDAGAAVEAGIDAGRPSRIRITDLLDQVAEEQWVRQASEGADRGASTGAATASPKATSVTAVVAVAAGDGVAGILRSLGVGCVVAGGQSMNPSTAELLAAVEGLDAKGVVILPNNRNVVAVAQRVGPHASRPVVVVPTAGIPEAMAALLAFDADADVDTNATAMGAAAATVRWGEVTWAVRDANTPAGPVSEGDALGLVGDKIAVAGSDRVDVACRLLDRLLDDGDELVTVLVGAGVPAAETEQIEAWLAENHPAVGVEVHSGGQPLSSYIFSAE